MHLNIDPSVLPNAAKEGKTAMEMDLESQWGLW